MNNRLIIGLAMLALVACGGGDHDRPTQTLHFTPSVAQAQWNVSTTDVRRILDACFPHVEEVSVTDVQPDGRAHLYLGGVTVTRVEDENGFGKAVYTYHGPDVGDPKVIHDNLPECPAERS